jgi:hypothetical protein
MVRDLLTIAGTLRPERLTQLMRTECPVRIGRNDQAKHLAAPLIAQDSDDW